MRAVVLLSVLLAGCSYDFDEYLPADASAAPDSAAADTASGDTGAPDAAAMDTTPVDAGCVPDGGDACYATARSCSMTCSGTRTTCEAACTNPSCRKDCRDAETTCKAKCTSDCTACTTSGGCTTAARCASEVG